MVSANGELNYLSKILIVDDMLMHLETAKLYLEAAGFEVFCASNVTNAWTTLAEQKPDLVLLDVVMPGGNGLELLSNIQRQYPHTEVIIMTAFGSENVAATALKLGAVDYIRKPVKYSTLAQVVDKALARQKQLKCQEKKVATLEHAYEELQVSADSILQCMSSGLVAVDRNLHIRMINQRAKELLGIQNKEVLGQLIYDIFPVFKSTQVLKHTLEKGEPIRTYEMQLTTPGGIRLFNFNTDLIYDHLGQKIGAVGIFDDITDLRRKDEMLRERERLAIIGQMAAGMAHEIKNPLTSIKGFTQLLSLKSKDTNLKQYLEIISEEINRMNQVIQDFLQLAKPKLVEFKMTNLNDIIKEILSIIEPQAFLKNVETMIKLNPLIPPTWLDPSQIKQVLLNLTQNSLEAMASGGSLKIETSFLGEKNEVCIDVTDTGCGIPADKIKELGVPFYTTKPTGTGLGLSISFSIVEKHRGRIEVQSVEGQGTTFSVFLPVGQ